MTESSDVLFSIPKVMTAENNDLRQEVLTMKADLGQVGILYR